VRSFSNCDPSRRQGNRYVMLNSCKIVNLQFDPVTDTDNVIRRVKGLIYAVTRESAALKIYNGSSDHPVIDVLMKSSTGVKSLLQRRTIADAEYGEGMFAAQYSRLCKYQSSCPNASTGCCAYAHVGSE